MLKLHRVWLVIAWLLVVWVVYLSLTPHPPKLPEFENADKYEHGLAYFALSFLFCQLYLSRIARGGVIAALIALGVALEYVQDWTGYRTFDVLDMLADAVGVLLGWGLVNTPLGGMLALIERNWEMFEKQEWK